MSLKPLASRDPVRPLARRLVNIHPALRPPIHAYMLRDSPAYPNTHSPKKGEELKQK